MGEEVSSCTLPEIARVATSPTVNLLPTKSREQYQWAYRIFMDWRRQNGIESFSENVLLAYFQKLRMEMRSSSSLKAIYSMLRWTINLNNNIDISKYFKVRLFLKRTSDGCKIKKSRILSPQEIKKFLSSAPDEHYLFTKVGLIFGIMGACHREELMKIEMSHVEDLNTSLLVHIPDYKTKTERQFVIGDTFYEICKKYMALRPSNLENVTRFFLNYQRGKCTKQPIGINKFGNLARQVAEFLKLPNPTSYTGHSLRRSSATILKDFGADVTSLKSHGEWRSISVGEGYLNKEIQTSNEILNAVEGNMENTEMNENSYSTFETKPTNINFDNIENGTTISTSVSDGKKLMTKPIISISNCQNVSNLTVNVYLPK